MSAAVPQVVGVVGAGTMGGGIAQLAVLAGARTLLHDPDHAALDRGVEALRSNLAKGAERGRWSAADAEAAAARIEPTHTLEALASRYGETTHYAVLDGREVVYRAKTDPPHGAVRLRGERTCEQDRK